MNLTEPLQLTNATDAWGHPQAWGVQDGRLTRSARGRRLDLGGARLLPGFINAHDIAISCEEQDITGKLYRRGPDCSLGMRHNVRFMISLIDRRLEDFDLLFCNERPVQSSDEFFGFTREHAAANNFNPANTALRFCSSQLRFYKHMCKLMVAVKFPMWS